MREIDIQVLRQRAENSVASMPDGELKTKAFEVILNHLLNDAKGLPAPSGRPESISKRSKIADRPSTRSSTARILVLKEEGFFVSQRTIGEVKDELARHGWHYALTALSGKMQTLVRRRELRRMKGNDGKRALWRYTEP